MEPSLEIVASVMEKVPSLESEASILLLCRALSRSPSVVLEPIEML